MRSAWLAFPAVLLGFTFVFPARGAAYCRTTTDESVASGCPEICQTAGLPLYWPKRSLVYVPNERGFPHLTDKQERDILQRSFDAWTAVRCGEPIDLRITQSARTTKLESGPLKLEPNDNAIAYIPASAWEDEPRAFAITKIWYSPSSGRIIGADMLINGHMDPFGICPEPHGCTNDSVTDLRNVVTHEAGHFLGLAHSDDEDSTMWCDASPGDIGKRTLSRDDIAGLCAIYGPGADAGPPESKKNSSGCGVAAGARGAESGGAAFLTLAGLFVVRRRARRRDRP